MVALAERDRRLGLIGTVTVLAVPAYAIARQAVEDAARYAHHRQALDRVERPEWLANLMDGMRYRFSHSPPLNPDKATIAEQVGRAASNTHSRRGFEEDSFRLRTALENVKDQGTSCTPRYMASGSTNSTSMSASQPIRYHQLGNLPQVRSDGAARSTGVSSSAAQTDPRSQQVFEAAPQPWHSSGPTITIYRLSSSCGPGSARSG